jgi:hypothetical protein
MTKRIYILLTLCALTCLGWTAQGNQDAFDVHVASMRVLERRDVQADMGITAAQRSQMDMYADQFNLQVKNYGDQLKKEGKNPSGPDDRMISMLTGLKAKVITVLTPSQLRRLREISLQEFGLNGLMDDVVAQRVGLSKDQLAKMRKAYEAGSRKASDMMAKAMQPVDAKFKNVKPKNPTEADTDRKSYLAASDKAMNAVMPAVQKVRADTQKSILAMVTAKQKQTYLALQGKKFTPKDK